MSRCVLTPQHEGCKLVSGVTLSALSSSLVLLLAGAAVGFVPTYLNERAKRKHELTTRWDGPLFQLCRELAAATRLLEHLCGQFPETQERERLVTRVDDEQARIRSLVQQIHLLGSLDLQRAASAVGIEAAAVRASTAADSATPSDHEHGVLPEQRLRERLRLFYIAARRQLGVADPTRLGPELWLDAPTDLMPENYLTHDDPKRPRRFN
jgi:hypothetical protein